jgi:hypothetical protein
MHDWDKGPSLHAADICTANVFLDALQLFVLEKTDDSEQKKKVQFCLNKTVLHPFSAMNYEYLDRWISESVDWNRRNNNVVATKSQLFISGFFQWCL